MSPELTYLAWTALLTALLWVPYIAGQVITNGFLAGENYTDPTPRPAPNWVRRANRAHINAVETFAPFAAMVWLIHATHSSSEMTALWAAIFFWMRIAHAVVYMLGIPYIRTLVFATGTVSIVGLFYELVT